MGSVNINLGFGGKSEDQKYRYKDIQFTLSKKENQREFNDLKDLAAIQNGISNIFSWIPGERILLPEFGNNIKSFLYEPITPFTAENIGNEIKNMLERWEPRVVIEEVFVQPYEDTNEYEITVKYSVPTLGYQTVEFDIII